MNPEFRNEVFDMDTTDWKKYTLTSMDTMLKLILIKHILIKTVLVKRIISGRNNYVYRKRTWNECAGGNI